MHLTSLCMASHAGCMEQYANSVHQCQAASSVKDGHAHSSPSRLHAHAAEKLDYLCAGLDWKGTCRAAVDRKDQIVISDVLSRHVMNERFPQRVLTMSEGACALWGLQHLQHYVWVRVLSTSSTLTIGVLLVSHQLHTRVQ